jgi:choline dehydrogenase-like flavoprotein
VAEKMLKGNGFTTDPRYIRNQMFVPKTAFHPSGSIELGNDPKEHSFNFEGLSNHYQNLMVGGSATIGSGSWVNPTLPVMTIMLGNIRDYLTQTGKKL